MKRPWTQSTRVSSSKYFSWSGHLYGIFYVSDCSKYHCLRSPGSFLVSAGVLLEINSSAVETNRLSPTALTDVQPNKFVRNFAFSSFVGGFGGTC